MLTIIYKKRIPIRILILVRAAVLRESLFSEPSAVLMNSRYGG